MIEDPQGLCLLVYIFESLLLIRVVIVQDLSINKFNICSMLGLMDIYLVRRGEASYGKMLGRTSSQPMS